MIVSNRGPARYTYYGTLSHCVLGGYTRHSTTFHRTSAFVDAPPSTSQVMTASSSTSLSSSSSSSSSSLSSIPVVVFIATSEVEEYVGPQSLDSLANIISTSIGPSGKNSEYLFNLAEAVRCHFPDVEDAHLFELERMVREKIL